MENIIDLILNEFRIANYRLLDTKLELPILTNETSSDFWMILNDYDVTVDKQQELFERYRQEMKEYPVAEKNTSVLVLKSIPQFDEVSQTWAVETENDKYYFKKYVLLYTQNAWDTLKKEILDDPQKSLSYYLADPSNFSLLKDDTPEGPYTLLYGIAHKLPFLLVKMERSNLELSYPTTLATSEKNETNEWVNGTPDTDEEITAYLDELLKSIDHEEN